MSWKKSTLKAAAELRISNDQCGGICGLLYLYPFKMTVLYELAACVKQQRWGLCGWAKHNESQSTVYGFQTSNIFTQMMS
jgi:hypothetical protein